MKLKHGALIFKGLALLTALLCFFYALISNIKPAAEPLQLKKSTLALQNSNAQAHITNKININKAGKKELMQLYGIGDKTADSIIQNRPYYYPEDLMLVSGIGERRFEQIKEFIVLE
ncbi:MAG: helix-hairpin-helix domain-containing protein [Eubacteriales bacterium]|nr:helix-hairpin-helix domain-containing protein [Eubacteriales bacterium]